MYRYHCDGKNRIQNRYCKRSRTYTKKDDWQAFDPVTIAGITHKKSDGDTDNWKGIPKADGVCEISYNKEKNTVVFNWKGSKTEESTIDFTLGLHQALDASGLLTGTLKDLHFFEIDSTYRKSDMAKEIRKYIKDNSLLNHGTWAYYGDATKNSERYLFWTSFDLNKDKSLANKEIPVIISTADGKYYVSSSKATQRNYNGVTYITIVDKKGNSSQYKPYIEKGTKYDSLEEAYKAYANVVKNDYPKYKDTLPQ